MMVTWEGPFPSSAQYSTLSVWCTASGVIAVDTLDQQLAPELVCAYGDIASTKQVADMISYD